MSLLVVAMGCAGQTLGYPPDPQEPRAIARHTFPYTLMPGDTVDVEVWKHEEFSGRSAIAPDGGLEIRNLTSVPDTVQAQGQTVGALSIQIAAVLSRYVEDPIVHVRMAHHGSRRVYVLGEVANPGIQKLDEFGLTLRDAVVRAGLPTEAAALGRVAVIQGPPGELRRRIIDLEEILNEGRLANNVTLMPNAVVYVPRSHSDWLMKSVLEPLIKLGAGAFVFFRLGEEAGLI